MKRIPASLAAIAVTAAGFAAGFAAWAELPKAAPATTHGPVVVELFQSQGCSDCPPAQANLNTLADRPDVLALSYGVTYWDYLGWKDSFASPAFTARQRDYSAHNRNAGVATPQYWINGRETILGANPARVGRALAQGGPAEGPALRLAGNRVAIGAGKAPADGADIWLVRYDPRTIEVAIKAGENGGRTVPHRDIVRELTGLGRWNGAAREVALPAARIDGLRTAILVQGRGGGPILSAARQ